LDKLSLILLNAAFLVMLASILIAFLRMLKGPTSADRTMALDVMTIVGISVIALIALVSGRIIYLDVAMVYALLSFLGVVAVARYLERGL